VRELADGRFGRVLLVVPPGPPDALVFLFSDATGWDAGSDAAASALVTGGRVVVGVDLAVYLQTASSRSTRARRINATPRAPASRRTANARRRTRP